MDTLERCRRMRFSGRREDSAKILPRWSTFKLHDLKRLRSQFIIKNTSQFTSDVSHQFRADTPSTHTPPFGNCVAARNNRRIVFARPHRTEFMTKLIICGSILCDMDHYDSLKYRDVTQFQTKLSEHFICLFARQVSSFEITLLRLFARAF